MTEIQKGRYYETERLIDKWIDIQIDRVTEIQRGRYYETERLIAKWIDRQRDRESWRQIHVETKIQREEREREAETKRYRQRDIKTVR